MSVELGNRVKHWATLNEPWEMAWQGYVTGEDAPGLRLGNEAALKASHNALLAHGAAVRTLRDNTNDAEIGIVLHLNMVEPASEQPEDIAAAHRWELCQNRWYMDALYREGLPTRDDEAVRLRCARGPPGRHGADPRANRLPRR